MAEPKRTPLDRPDARQLRGVAEQTYDEAQQRPEEPNAPEEEQRRALDAEEQAHARRRRRDLTADPDELGARFLNDAVQGDPLEEQEAGAVDAVEDLQAVQEEPLTEEEEAEQIERTLPVGEEEDFEDRSRAELPPSDTAEGDPAGRSRSRPTKGGRR